MDVCVVSDMVYSCVSPNFDSTDIWRSYPGFYCEMSRDDHGFICGLLSDRKPNKIVEIGVSSGGTTSVVMSHMEKLGVNGKMFSVDINKNWYRNPKKKSGFFYSQHCSNNEYLFYEHEFILGQTIAKALPYIGKGIDFVILDTTHALPGELLDFLALFTYLVSGAVIVLHDVNLNCMLESIPEKDFYRENAIASKILFSLIKGRKYYNTYAPNISAVQVDETTGGCIKDIFFFLAVRWYYWPKNQHLLQYRQLYSEVYPSSLLDMYDAATKLNERYHGVFHFPYEEIEQGSNIIVYGGGAVGKSYVNEILESRYCNIIGVCDRDPEQTGIREVPVFSIDELMSLDSMDYDYVLIATVNETMSNEMISTLKINGIPNYKIKFKLSS